MRARDTIRACVGMFRMRFIAGLQYRTAAWAGIATQFAWGFLLLSIYKAFYDSSSMAIPMPFSQIAALVWLQQGLAMMIFLWVMDNELLEAITSGQVAYELCRPVPLYAFWYARLLALRLSRMLLRVGPVLLVAFLLPEPYRLLPPPSPEVLGLFLLSLSLSGLLVVAISMFAYLFTFKTLSPGGAQLLVALAGDFLAGITIPIPMMPPAMQTILSFLPFRYVADLPFRVFSGNIAGSEALFGIAVQCGWIVALAALGAYGFRRVSGRIVLQGG